MRGTPAKAFLSRQVSLSYVLGLAAAVGGLGARNVNAIGERVTAVESSAKSSEVTVRTMLERHDREADQTAAGFRRELDGVSARVTNVEQRLERAR